MLWDQRYSRCSGQEENVTVSKMSIENDFAVSGMERKVQAPQEERSQLLQGIVENGIIHLVRLWFKAEYRQMLCTP